MAGFDRCTAGVLALLALALGCAHGGPTQSRGAEAALERYRHDRAAEAPAASASRSGEELLAEGDRARDGGRVAEALLRYLEAHRHDRELTEPRERIAFLHLRGDPELAATIFSEILTRRPEAASAHLGLGMARLAQGRSDDAIAPLEEAVRLDADSGAAHGVLAVLLDRAGRHEEARAHYVVARTLHPGDAAVHNNLGVSLLLTEEWEAAAEAFRAAVRLAPRDPVVRNNLGLALGRLGRYEEAWQAFRAAGSEAEAHNNLGYVHYLNGDVAGALEHYEKALDVPGEQLPVVLRNIELAREQVETPADFAE